MAGHQGQSSKSMDHVPDHDRFVWSEEPLRLIFENSPDAILLSDEDQFIDCNRSALEMLRYSSRELLLSLSPNDLSPEIQPDGQPSLIKAKEMIAIAIQNGSHRFEWS